MVNTTFQWDADSTDEFPACDVTLAAVQEDRLTADPIARPVALQVIADPWVEPARDLPFDTIGFQTRISATPPPRPRPQILEAGTQLEFAGCHTFVVGSAADAVVAYLEQVAAMHQVEITQQIVTQLANELLDTARLPMYGSPPHAWLTLQEWLASSAASVGSVVVLHERPVLCVLSVVGGTVMVKVGNPVLSAVGTSIADGVREPLKEKTDSVLRRWFGLPPAELDAAMSESGDTNLDVD